MIILASNSPRRRELLQQIGVRFRVHAVDIDETPLQEESPLHYVQRIAAEKSVACADQLKTSDPVLAADTAVVLNGIIMGKPKDQADALFMLRQLANQTHQVYSAVSLRINEAHHEAVSITNVTFRALSDAEILAYWHTGEPADKAGAYAIQGLGALFVQHIQGSFSGVVGLPLFETSQLLQQQGIRIL